MENLLLQGSYYDSVLKISNFGYSKSSVLDSVAVTLKLGGGGGGQVCRPANDCALCLLIAQFRSQLCSAWHTPSPQMRHMDASGGSSEGCHSLQVLYSAPELMLGNPGREGYDGAAVDIWSCAICLYNMLFAQMPFLVRMCSCGAT